jgi:putative ABC transport system permease protein
MIRIALTMLRTDRAKCTAMILAVTFSVFLMQNQCAILASLYRMMTAQIDDVTDAPLWVMEPDTRCFEQAKPVKDGTLERVRSRSGVAWAVPLLKIDTMARSDSGLLCTVTVMGVDEASMVGLPSRFRFGQPEAIRPAGTCAVDPGGYAQLFPGEPVHFPRRIRILDESLVLTGMTDCSRVTALRLNKAENRTATFIIGDFTPGANRAAVCESITAATGLAAMDRAGFGEMALRFYNSQGVPRLFWITIAIGLLTGTAITAQTFSMFVREHTTQLAVCRVIGVTKARIIAMVVCQGLFVLSIGCAFGTGLTAITTHAAASEPFLRGIVLPPPVAAGTCAALAAITITAVTIMARRVALMDPAIVFRS